jgi:DNA (cytosine-5)-methyltransferase 1
MAFDWQSGGDARGLDPKHTAQLQRGQVPAAMIPIGIDGGDLAYTLRADASHSGDKGDGGMNTTTVSMGLAVRRLTPVECERLQGFPDHWTQIPYRSKPSTNCPDGPRYKAIGNSMARPVMTWLGKRIVNALRS